MGLVNFPQVEEYWATTWPYSNLTFSKVMSRDRFSLLMRFLHLNDSTGYIKKGEPGHDPLYKLQPLLELNFQAAYIPGRELSVDESMIGFKGRLSWIQYMPKKPTKWGMKAFTLSDSTSAYTWNWILYTGAYNAK